MDEQGLWNQALLNRQAINSNFTPHQQNGHENTNPNYPNVKSENLYLNQHQVTVDRCVTNNEIHSHTGSASSINNLLQQFHQNQHQQNQDNNNNINNIRSAPNNVNNLPTLNPEENPLNLSLPIFSRPEMEHLDLNNSLNGKAGNPLSLSNTNILLNDQQMNLDFDLFQHMSQSQNQLQTQTAAQRNSSGSGSNGFFINDQNFSPNSSMQQQSNQQQLSEQQTHPSMLCSSVNNVIPTYHQNNDDNTNTTSTPVRVAEDAAQKRQTRLLKNREAARECRKKKKEYIKTLEERVARLEDQNKRLIDELRELKNSYLMKEEEEHHHMSFI